MPRNMKKGIALAAGATAILALGSAGGAVAGDMVSGRQITDQSVTSRDLGASSVHQSELANRSVDWYALSRNTRAKVESLAGQDGKDGADGAQGLQGPKGDKGDKGDPGSPASDMLGELLAQGNSGALVPLQAIGGHYADNATDLFTLELPEAGTYLLNADGYFDRLDKGAAGYEAPTTATRLQLTVRGGDANLTCFTGPMDPGGYTEATCSGSQILTVDAPTTLTVRGFGYNEDRTGFGGAPNSATPQFSAFAALSAVKVG